MTDDRDEIKARLLALWVDDLQNDREPGLHPELASLTPAEIKEVMALARFAKAGFYRTTNLPADTGAYARGLADRLLEERAKQDKGLASLVPASSSFGDLVQAAVAFLRVDRSGLRTALGLPQLTLSQLESGVLPPHRLPIETMCHLLLALRLESKSVIGLVRRSSVEWARRIYAAPEVQLGRIDVTLPDKDRTELMRSDRDLSTELGRIEGYCARLSSRLG